jgi:flavin reductase (DIM6/NTAB) family NADH-FMN oxidoreductase RutF
MLDLDALFKINCGMYIVCSKKGNKFDGCIANAVFQVIPEPIMIAASVNKQCLTCDYINDSKVFTVSIISDQTAVPIIDKFESKSDGNKDKFIGIEYKLGRMGAPIILDNTVAFLEVQVKKTVNVETHTLFIGEIIAGQVLAGNMSPMTYSYYRDLKQGRLSGDDTTSPGK